MILDIKNCSVTIIGSICIAITLKNGKTYELFFDDINTDDNIVVEELSKEKSVVILEE